MARNRIRLKAAIAEHLRVRSGHLASKTIQQETHVLRRFGDFIGDIWVENLTADHVERFFLSLQVEHRTRDGRIYPPVQASTYNYLYARIKALANFLNQRGYTRQDLMRFIRPRRVDVRSRLHPDRDLIWDMLDAAPDLRDRAMLATAINTGLRSQDLGALKIGDYDAESLSLRVWIHKSRVDDIKPVTSDLAHELGAWLDEYRHYQADTMQRLWRPDDFLFPARRRHTLRWEEINGVRQPCTTPGGWDPQRPVRRPHLVVQEALAACGVETKHEGVHTLRRGSARLLFDSLVDEKGYDGALRVVSSFLNHTNVSTTERYLGLSTERRTRDQHLRGRSLLGPRPAPAVDNVTPLRKPDAQD